MLPAPPRLAPYGTPRASTKQVVHPLQQERHWVLKGNNWDLLQRQMDSEAQLFFGYFYFSLRFLFLLLFKETHTNTQREKDRVRDTGRGTTTLHSWSPTWNSIPGLKIMPWAVSGTKPLSHPEMPRGSSSYS